MIPSKETKLGLWERFWEFQYKILFSSPNTQNVHSHMYSSEPLDWPLMVRGVAYWLSEHDNVSKFNLIHIIHYIYYYYNYLFKTGTNSPIGKHCCMVFIYIMSIVIFIILCVLFTTPKKTNL